jgi:hypothetical protein
MPTLLSLLYCLLNLPVQYYAKISCADLCFFFFFNFSSEMVMKCKKRKCLQMHLIMYFFYIFLLKCLCYGCGRQQSCHEIAIFQAH